MFYHGFDNYMVHAFPEDELRPVACRPLTRDVANPAHVELNDPLGNYSLTLIDTLSTLAIQASNPGSERQTQRSWKAFQHGVASLVKLYGDGTDGSEGQGTRARGFDLDSKVQVFETVIRGVGGLLSAHLFAIGELPITGYEPSQAIHIDAKGHSGIRWSKNFVYDGQLLRLAHDMGRRLLPAFSTPTGIPYPRVNLRHGIPFYPNSPLNKALKACQAGGTARCPVSLQPDHEQTETCSAGAGSLLLEFIVLSRLTGDQQYEQLAKRAFWSVWDRRSSTGLVGAGIDAESGIWIGASTGVSGNHCRTAINDPTNCCSLGPVLIAFLSMQLKPMFCYLAHRQRIYQALKVTRNLKTCRHYRYRNKQQRAFLKSGMKATRPSSVTFCAVKCTFTHISSRQIS